LAPEEPPTSVLVLERPRLFDLVERGISGPLTLVSAPAGSGKTILLRSWMAATADPGRIAHLALTREHRDRHAFWLDVLAAIAAAQPDLSGLPAPARGAGSLAGFRSRLDGLEEPLVLVLDDFHVVGTGDVLTDVGWLLERPHPALRLVIATRSDPPIRLERLRLAGHLSEVRAADLAFTDSEAGELLAPLELPAAEVEQLRARTEGWAAALRLAGISLQGHTDASGFIARFAGDDRAVTDYLASEVLSGYDEKTLWFLLRTSIVEQVNGELAEALTGATDGRRSLLGLTRTEGFVEALDSTGTWFRYHQLFAEVPGPSSATALRTSSRPSTPRQPAGTPQTPGRWRRPITRWPRATGGWRRRSSASTGSRAS
jgi:LuxR family maltose regulon positive regulatory protein